MGTTMSAPKKKQLANCPAEVEYRGKQTRTGNSSGFRFEGALFKSHPEFNGEVKARVIAPGRLLVMAEPAPKESSDPVMESFLAFLAQDMVNHPAKLGSFDAKLAKRVRKLTKGIAVDPNEDLGNDVIL
jgi:antitoxin PrlF